MNRETIERAAMETARKACAHYAMCWSTLIWMICYPKDLLPERKDEAL